VILLTDSDAFAGTERHILELAAGLRDGGSSWSVRVACPGGAPLARRAVTVGLGVLPVEKRGRLVDRDAVKALTGELRSGRARIIHAHNGRTALAAAMAVRLARRGSVVFTQHFLEPSHAASGRHGGPKAALFAAAHGWVGRNTAHYIAISQAVRDSMVMRGEPADAARVTVIPNGLTVDAAAVRPAALVRAELGVAADAPLVVCAARLEPEKDVPTLIRAMGEVVRRLPGAVCVVAGEGRQRDALCAQIGAAGLEGRVRLLGFRDDVTSIMAAGDVFVLPSLAEPFGLVLLEAMALGRPVVATRAGGPAEIVVDGGTGLLVPPGSPAEMSEALLACLNSEVGWRMGEAGRRRYETEFTAERMSRATAAVYERVAGGRGV
jgi:glycosyltransferase involved in cell wall biosynthesis